MENKDITQFEILREIDSYKQKPGGKTKTVDFFKQVSLNKQTSSRSTSLHIETPSNVNDSNLVTSDSFASSSLISESKVLTDIQYVESSSSSKEDEAPPNKMVPDVTEDFV
ncbi:hypothetical protein DPMN_108683 [Dreissena polymorpha]|uniref:Uncharacterized protein n=1 Tax=Dreissena polymorpha TaxID=45954 RepID=A0A9D4K9K5_DREPO|nr:hypothetical protein DPMN_108683 [Dreissena polymorpha]